MKLTERLAKAKNKLRRDFRHNPREFLNAVRAYNKVVKATSRTESGRNTLRKEKAFNANPWSFSKAVCHQHTKTPLLPQFSAETCFNYFKPTFEALFNSNYSELPQAVTGLIGTVSTGPLFRTVPMKYISKKIHLLLREE